MNRLKEILLNDNWLFHKENEVEGCVTLPHTYNAVDGQSGISMWRGNGFYKKEVLFSEEDLKEKIFLEIGASAMKSTVYEWKNYLSQYLSIRNVQNCVE